MIIGFTGKKGSGKTTAAQHLVNHAADIAPGAIFTRQSYAEPMREMVQILLWRLGYDDIGDIQDKDADLPEIGVSLRRLMQTLGTQWGREMINPDLWVNLLQTEIQLNHHPEQNWHVVIDDVRYENEADYIRDEGGLIIHINRPSHKTDDTHSSEQGIVYKPGDETITNNGDEDYLHQVICLVQGVFAASAGQPV